MFMLRVCIVSHLDMLCARLYVIWCTFFKYPILIRNVLASQFQCNDLPNFKDKYQTTCAQTKKFENCKGGRAIRQGLENDANEDGISVLDACCVCGGGLKHPGMRK